MLITNGSGKLGRIYEKLRKRSYRRSKRRSWHEHPSNRSYHQGYVEGVKDALAEAAPLVNEQ